MITFTVYGKPQGKARARTVRNRFTGKVHSFTPDKTSEYENLIRYAYHKQGGKITDGPLSVFIVAFVPIPASFSKKQKAAAVAGELFPEVKPDNDNIEKIVFDALNGIAYKDDIQIVNSSTVKRFDSDPRIEVTVRRLETGWRKVDGKYKEISL